MLLSGRVLDNVSGVNSFSYTDCVKFTEGDVITIYFQLVDLNKDTASEGFIHPGRRYCPASGATLSVSLVSYDDDKTITRSASKAYSTSDTSIWYISLLATDQISGSFDIKLTLTESTVVTRGVIHNAIRANPVQCSY